MRGVGPSRRAARAARRHPPPGLSPGGTCPSVLGEPERASARPKLVAGSAQAPLREEHSASKDARSFAVRRPFAGVPCPHFTRRTQPTLTRAGADVAEFPAASVATAVMVWAPRRFGFGFHDTEYGAVWSWATRPPSR